MPLMKMTEEEIMADILNRLVQSGHWGTRHQDVDQLVNWMKNYVKKNDDSVKKAIKQLSKERFIGYKNNKRSIYLNTRYRREIYDFIDEHLLEDTQ